MSNNWRARSYDVPQGVGSAGPPTIQEDGPGLSISNIWPILYGNIRFITLVAACFVILAVVWMKLTGPQFVARMVVGQAASLPQMGSGSSLLSSFSGMSLGGLLGSTRSPLYERFEELLSSQRVAARVERKHQIMLHIFETRWDSENRRWRQPEGIRAAVSRSIKGFFGVPFATTPDIASLAVNIQKKLMISNTKNTNLREIEFQDRDREFALDMLRWLYEEADESIRQDDIKRTQAEISYLRRELDQVTSVEHRTALTNLLENEEQRQMLLLSGAPYGATVVVPPEAPTIPNMPKIMLTIPLAAFVGMLVSSLFLVWKAIRLQRLMMKEGASLEEIHIAMRKLSIPISLQTAGRLVAVVVMGIKGDPHKTRTL